MRKYRNLIERIIEEEEEFHISSDSSSAVKHFPENGEEDVWGY